MDLCFGIVPRAAPARFPARGRHRARLAQCPVSVAAHGPLCCFVVSAWGLMGNLLGVPGRIAALRAPTRKAILFLRCRRIGLVDLCGAVDCLSCCGRFATGLGLGTFWCRDKPVQASLLRALDGRVPVS